MTDDAKERLPVCASCNDAHRMPGSSWLCTYCPVPCEHCVGGSFCKQTPCPCACHAGDERYANRDKAEDAEERLRARGWSVDDERRDRWKRFVRDDVVVLICGTLTGESRWWEVSTGSDSVAEGGAADLESACLAAERALEQWLRDRLEALTGGKP